MPAISNKDPSPRFIKAVQKHYGLTLEITEEKERILLSIGFVQRHLLFQFLKKIYKANRAILDPHNQGSNVVDTLIRLATKYTVKDLKTVFNELQFFDFANLAEWTKLMALMESFDNQRFSTQCFDNFAKQSECQAFIAVYKASFKQIKSMNSYKTNGVRYCYSISPSELFSPLNGKGSTLFVLLDIIKKLSATQYLKRNDFKELFTKDIKSLQKMLEMMEILSKAKLLNHENLECVFNQPHVSYDILYNKKGLDVQHDLLLHLYRNHILTQRYLRCFKNLKALAQNKAFTISRDDSVILSFLAVIIDRGERNTLTSFTLKGILFDAEAFLTSPENAPKFLTTAILEKTLSNPLFNASERWDITMAFFEGAELKLLDGYSHETNQSTMPSFYKEEKGSSSYPSYRTTP